MSGRIHSFPFALTPCSKTLNKGSFILTPPAPGRRRHKHYVGTAIVAAAYAFLVLSDAFCTRGGASSDGGAPLAPPAPSQRSVALCPPARSSGLQVSLSPFLAATS